MNALIDDLVTANHILYHQGVLDGYGHVSIRDPRNAEHFLMARALAPGLVTADDIMEFDADANPIDRRGRNIYSERFIHSEVYKVRKDVNAVVHSHSPTVIPFSVTKRPLRAIATTSAFLAGGVPVFEIRKVAGLTDMLVTDGIKGEALARTLGRRPVALLRGHGNVVVGPDLHRVVARAIYTEIGARLQMQAMTLGGPINYVKPEEAALIERVRETVLPGGGHGQDRTWDMWKAEVTGKTG